MSTQQSNTQLGQDEENIRLDFYAEYGNHVFEDLETFCNRMATLYGEDWMNILSR